MPDQHVLDDRKPKPRAAGGPRAASIDAVETLGQPRQVFRCDADAAIRDREFAAVLRSAEQEHHHEGKAEDDEADDPRSGVGAEQRVVAGLVTRSVG